MSDAKTQVSLNYIPAVLKHQPSHGWSVEYYVMDRSGTMRRMVIRMNALRKRFTRTADFKAHCNGVVCRLNAQLAGGWTPFGETQNTRLFTPIESVVDDYLAEKSKELRPDTVINYRSFSKVFKEWIADVCPNGPISSFNKVLAVRFMDYLSKEKGLKGRSYNNRLKQARAFFGWAVEKCYAKENPFAVLKKKREETKKRILIPHDVRVKIRDYWKDRNDNYITLCEMVFTALIRPKECWRLQVQDLQLAEGYIVVSEDDSKTHYRRSASLSRELIGRLQRVTAKAKPTDYLFGKDYEPGKKQMAYSRFRKDWIDMRAALKLPSEMQLYSLRDTGINEMLKVGIDALSVMQHADHHDLSMTTRYANHVDPKLVETISTKAPAF